MNIFIKFLLFVSFFQVVQAACPNSCSGHGFCESGNVCSCFTGFNGGAADCSMRTCPTGKAWADKAYATDKAHQLIECSNAGICDRKSGQCQCFDGYTGSACQRSTCPNDCSGHGNCLTINDISVFEGPPYDPTTTFKGDGRGSTYTNWDQNSITICDCDNGYFGADCSLAMCPKGDDPLTIDQNYRQFQINVYAGNGYFSGTLGIQFMSGTVVLSLTNPSNAECIEAFEDSILFGYVNCEYQEMNSNQYQYDITVYSWPVYPQENNLHTHDGNPSVTDFYCDTSNTNDGIYCVFKDIVNTNIREYEYCSLRGTCDFSSGLCSCDSGFGGPACSNLTYAYTSGSNALPGLQVLVNEVDYIGTALDIISTKSPASDFYFIEATANNEQIFYIRGDGLVGIRKLYTITGGHTIAGGGLYVLSGGCTIVGDPLSVYTSSTDNLQVGLFESKSTAQLNSSYSVLKVASLSTSDTHYLFTASNQYTERFQIRSDGNVAIYSGGLGITGGLTVYNTGLLLKYGGVTINNGGLDVTNGGISVMNTGIRVTSGITINSGGLKVLMGGMQVYAGGVSIYSGGLKISGGGLSMTSAGIAITGGLTVNTRGIRVTGGLTVNSYGLYITTQGVTIANGGLVVTGGITVQDTGFLSTDGITVSSGGIFLTGGLTIANTGLAVTDGLSILSGGATIQGDLNVQGSIYGSGLLSVSSLYVGNGGMTVEGSVSATTPYLIVTSDRRLKSNIEPVIGAMNKISKLRGVYFNWIKDDRPDDLEFDENRHIGLLAQDVQDAVPEAVHEIGQGKYLGIDYSSLVPLIINAINEMKEKGKDKEDNVISNSSSNNSNEKNDKNENLMNCEEKMIRLERKIESMIIEIEQLKKDVYRLPK